MLTTSNYDFNKPESTDVIDIEDLNDNFDTVDQVLKVNADGIASEAVARAEADIENSESIEAHKSDYSHHIYYALDSGSTDAYSITIEGITAYSQLIGVPLYVKCPTANSTVASLNVNGLGAVNIVRETSTALLTGDITAGKIIQVIYDESYFQLLSQGADASQASKSETLSNKSLTAPKIASGGYIADANGNELIKASSVVSSAVNEITVKNAVTGSAPSISASGGDTNVSLNLISKGTGTVQANGVAVATKSKSVSVTLSSSSWSGSSAPYTYTVTVSGVTSTSNQELTPATSITLAQLQALQAANIIGYSQTTNSVTLRAWGTKPTINIPVVFTVRGDA